MTTPTVLDVPADEVGRHPDALARLFAGSLAAVIVRGAYDPARLASLHDRFDREDDGIPTIRSPFFAGRAWGRALSVEPDQRPYLAFAAEFEPRARAVFEAEGLEPYPALLERLTGALGEGYRVGVARSPEGRSFVPFSLREMLPGGGISPHYENEAFDMPGMDAVRPRLRSAHQLSAYVTVARPEGGGALRLYHLLGTEPAGAALRPLPRSGTECSDALERTAPWTDLDVRTGDLLLFDSGRYWHRVTPVEGSVARWTLGGFLGLADDGVGVLYWS